MEPVVAEPRGSLGRRLVRKVAQGIAFGNLATLAVLQQHGPRAAVFYLQQLARTYHDRRELLCRSDEIPLLPVRTPATALPEAHFDEVVLLHPVPLPGGVSTLELAVLAVAARAWQPRRIVEIGTATGRTTINLACHAPEAEVLTFDLPPQAPAAELRSGPDYRALGLDRPGIVFAGRPEAERIQTVLCASTAYDWSPLAGTVDLMFIDGAHDLETVRQDTVTARQIVRPGGLVFWHDYGHVAGVTQALNELSTELPPVHLTDTMLAMLRVPEA